MDSNNLHVFSISKDDNLQDEHLIEMWHELDNDYSEEGYDEGNLPESVVNKLRYSGYKSAAEMMIKRKDWAGDGHDDLSKIGRVLNWIKQGHGDHSYQFKSLIKEVDGSYVVAVSYLT